MKNYIKTNVIDEILNEIPFGAPVCHFYSTMEESIEFALALIKRHLPYSHKFFWIHHDDFPRQILIEKLECLGITSISESDVDSFQLMSFQKWVELHKQLVAKNCKDVWESMLSESTNLGYAGITVIFSMSYIDHPETMKALDVQAAVRNYIYETPVSVFSQYDLTDCNPADLVRITSEHEYSIMKDGDSWTRNHNILHRHARNALERSRNYYLSLFEEFPALIWRAGLNGLCDYFNKNWLAFTGRTIEEEVGNGWVSGVHPDDVEECVSYYLTNFKQRKPFSMEYRLLRHDGEYRWISDMGMPFYDLDRNFAGYIGSCYDITSHREMEDTLRTLTKEAQEANQSKSMFLSNMSHEIRTPMNGIVGMLELLSISSLTPVQLDYVRKAKSSTDLLLRIINDILDLSKIEAGRMDLDYKAFDLKQVAELAIETIRLDAERKGLALNLDYDHISDFHVFGDPVRISQILINLMNNAVKFTDTGNVTLQFEKIEETENTLRLKISVADTGIGIPESMKERLFTNFSQLPNSGNRKFGGTGLGLAISKKLVSQMGGELDLESEEYSGSCFFFELVFNKSKGSTDSDEESPISATTLAESSVCIPHDKLHILLAEDDLINQEILQALLKDFFHLDVASNGKEALQLYEKHCYDAILMDVQMPIMNGFEATRSIRRLEEITKTHIPIIGFTAYAMSTDGLKCIEAGMDSFVSKPVDRSTLLKTLQAQLPNR